MLIVFYVGTLHFRFDEKEKEQVILVVSELLLGTGMRRSDSIDSIRLIRSIG